eukprot:5858374-Alexandrium_andersonii.AAC.1
MTSQASVELPSGHPQGCRGGVRHERLSAVLRSSGGQFCVVSSSCLHYRPLPGPTPTSASGALR